MSIFIFFKKKCTNLNGLKFTVPPAMAIEEEINKSYDKKNVLKI